MGSKERMTRIMGVTFGSIAVIVAAFAFAAAEPTSAALDSDLKDVRAAIRDADNDAAQYAGGLIKTQIELRKQFYKTTEAILLQKRSSLLRRIDLRYTVDGRLIEQASAEVLAALRNDIDQVSSQVTAAQNDSAKYSGGLIQAMYLSSVASGQLTIAGLRQKYYAAKWGIPYLAVDAASNNGTSLPTGNVVKDNDAF
jgi:hypothetical protein